MSDEAAKLVSGPVHLRLGDMFLKGVGTEQDPEQALMHYSIAEIMHYQMVKDGDVMYKNEPPAGHRGPEPCACGYAGVPA